MRPVSSACSGPMSLAPGTPSGQRGITSGSAVAVRVAMAVMRRGRRIFFIAKGSLRPASDQFGQVFGLRPERHEVGEVDGLVALDGFHAGNADEDGGGALLVAGEAAPLVGGRG